MTDKDRHTAHISEDEKQRAHKLLTRALEDLDILDQWRGFGTTAGEAVRMAMEVLSMKERP